MRHLVQALAAQGRNGDSELLHVTKGELNYLDQTARSRGLGSLPVNPVTGLHEASLFHALMPILGAGAGFMIAGPAGASIGGALGGGLAAKESGGNMLTGAALGGLGGYMGANALQGLGATEAATQGAAQAATPAADSLGAGAAAQAAPAATSVPYAAAGDQAAFTPGLSSAGTAVPYAPPAAPVADTGMVPYASAGEPSTSMAPGLGNYGGATPEAGASYANGPADQSFMDSSGLSKVASWSADHPMAAYVLGSGAANIIAGPHQSHQPAQKPYMWTGTRAAGSGTGYASGGITDVPTPKYSMSAPSNVVQYNASNPAPAYAMAPTSPNLQPTHAQMAQSAQDAGTSMSSSPANSGIGWSGPATTSTDFQGNPVNLPGTTFKGGKSGTILDVQGPNGWYDQAMNYSPTYNQVSNAMASKATPMGGGLFADMIAKVVGSGQYDPAGGTGNGGNAKGGILSLPSKSGSALPPAYLQGPGDGMSDNIPAAIHTPGKHPEPIRVADGEYVVPADVVAHLGNGSSNAGAKHLDKVMAKVRTARTGTSKQGKQIKPEKFL